MVNTICVILASLLSILQTGKCNELGVEKLRGNSDTVLPPVGKNIMYFDLMIDKQNISYIFADFGSNKQQMRLWLDLLDDQLDVVLEGSKWHTQGKYSPTKSVTCQVMELQDSTFQNKLSCLKESDFSNKVLRDNVLLSFQDKIHTTSTLYFEGLSDKEADKHRYTINKTDGTFGLAPYTAEIRDKELNLFYQLKNQGKISHMVFSVYSTLNKASHVKLGGYDELGALGNVSGNPNFKFIKTADNKSWRMNLKKVMTFGNNDEVQLVSTRYAIPEVSYPYIYMPMEDFNQIAVKLNNFYYDHIKDAVCATGKCQMKIDCDKLREIPLPGDFLSMTLQDAEGRSMNLHLNKDNMFLDTSQMKNAQGSTIKCQIPIFGQANEDTWYLGKAIMSNYYTIFDADKLDSESGGYLQVGMGPINPDDKIGKQLIDRHEREANQTEEESQAAVTVIILLIILVIVIVGIYAVIKFRKNGNDEVVFSDDPEERRNKRKSFIGSDFKNSQPIGPGECGINDEDVSQDQSQDDVSYDEEDTSTMWKAEMSQPNYSQSQKSKRFGKFDWAGIKSTNNSNSDSMLKQQISANSDSIKSDFQYDQLNSYESPSNHRLMRGFGLN